MSNPFIRTNFIVHTGFAYPHLLVWKLSKNMNNWRNKISDIEQHTSTREQYSNTNRIRINNR